MVQQCGQWRQLSATNAVFRLDIVSGGSGDQPRLPAFQKPSLAVRYMSARTPDRKNNNNKGANGEDAELIMTGRKAAVNSCWAHNDETKAGLPMTEQALVQHLKVFQRVLCPLVFPSSLISCVFIWRSVYFCSSFRFFGLTVDQVSGSFVQSVCLD